MRRNGARLKQTPPPTVKVGTISTCSVCPNFNVSKCAIVCTTSDGSFSPVGGSGCTSPVCAQLLAASAPTLGTAAPFGVLAASTVTNTGNTIINGDLGLFPGTSITGFPPGIVNGTIHQTDAVAQQAQADATTAYNSLASQAPTQVLTGQDLGGLTLTTGVYFFSSSAQLTGTLTLDGQGNPNAVFIFQIGSTLTTASASAVNFINGAQPCNAFWQVGSSATIGTTTAFVGTIIALASISMNTGAILLGRAIALTAAVTLQDNTISVSQCQGPRTGNCISCCPNPSVCLVQGDTLQVDYNVVVQQISAASESYHSVLFIDGNGSAFTVAAVTLNVVSTSQPCTNTGCASTPPVNPVVVPGSTITLQPGQSTIPGCSQLAIPIDGSFSIPPGTDCTNTSFYVQVTVTGTIAGTPYTVQAISGCFGCDECPFDSWVLTDDCSKLPPIVLTEDSFTQIPGQCFPQFSTVLTCSTGANSCPGSTFTNTVKLFNANGGAPSGQPIACASAAIDIVCTTPNITDCSATLTCKEIDQWCICKQGTTVAASDNPCNVPLLIYTITPTKFPGPDQGCTIQGSFEIGVDCFTYGKTITWTVYDQSGNVLATGTVTTTSTTPIPVSYTVTTPPITSIYIVLCWTPENYLVSSCTLLPISGAPVVCTDHIPCELTIVNLTTVATITDALSFCYNPTCGVPSFTPVFSSSSPVTPCEVYIAGLGPISPAQYAAIFGPGYVLPNDNPLTVIFSIQNFQCLCCVTNKVNLVVQVGGSTTANAASGLTIGFPNDCSATTCVDFVPFPPPVKPSGPSRFGSKR